MLHEIRKLIAQARRDGEAKLTVAMCYRATLYCSPWRLIVVPMPAQPPGSHRDLDPSGCAWGMGATVVAALIEREIGDGEATFKHIDHPLSPHEPLAFMFELTRRTDVAN